jgi:hypothetical protein
VPRSTHTRDRPARAPGGGEAAKPPAPTAPPAGQPLPPLRR